MRENNKTCICCGKKYTFCPSCSEFDKYPRWMNIYHDENCREIFMVTSDFIAGDIVKDEAKAIEKAFVTHNAEIKNEDGTVKAPESISVVLPDSVVFDYANRISVTVLNKADSTPVKGMIITVNEAPKQNDGVAEDTENPEQEENAENTENVETILPNTLTEITDEKGIAVFPP